ncbi:MAG: uridine kinase [Nannocystaceae bacterium]
MSHSPVHPPLIVGIAGGSGSGKTTVSRKIVEGLPSTLVSTIQHDAYYRDRPDLDDDARAAVNYDHPDSLETVLLVEHLQQLRSGESVEAPLYNFKDHRRSKSRLRIEPSPVIVVEGILVLADPKLRAMFDISLFVDTAADIRAFRRIKRDMEERGRTFESIRAQYYDTVRPMHLAFVEPSKLHADLIIPEGGDNRVAVDVILARLRASIPPGQ